MAQQLNLVNPAFRRSVTRLGARLLLYAIGGAYALSSVANMHARSDLAGLKTRRVQATAQLAEAKGEEERMKALTARREPDRKLVDEANRLDQKLQVQRDVLLALEAGGLGGGEGFGRALEALARQRVDGVWLTRIAMSATGEALQLEGGLLKAELLPAYIRALNREDAFRGKRFASMQIDAKERPIEQSGAVAKAGAPGSAGDAARATTAPYVAFRLGGAADRGNGVPR